MSNNINEEDEILKINQNTPKIQLDKLSDLSFSTEVQESDRRNSVFIPRPQMFLDEKEDILINISKHQRKIRYQSDRHYH